MKITMHNATGSRSARLAVSIFGIYPLQIPPKNDHVLQRSCGCRKCFPLARAKPIPRVLRARATSFRSWGGFISFARAFSYIHSLTVRLSYQVHEQATERRLDENTKTRRPRSTTDYKVFLFIQGPHAPNNIAAWIDAKIPTEYLQQNIKSYLHHNPRCLPLLPRMLHPGHLEQSSYSKVRPQTLSQLHLLTEHTATSYGREVNLHPTPTSDPNDPLNWSTLRKSVNFTLVSFYVFMTFVQLDTGFTAWQAYQNELPDLTVDFLNGAAAAGYVGLAVGCIFFIPLVHKYGRRPMYIFSILLQLGACTWSAVSYTRGDFVGNNFIAGLGGAISETIAQITIADLFFVHHHAVMNGFYNLAMFAGTYLGPVASGYMVDGQGWRWMWWWWAIFFGVNLVLVILFFEESKFVPKEHGLQPQISSDEMKEGPKNHVDATIPMNGYRQRMALVTSTKGSIWPDMVEPMVILYAMPAVTYAALTYGSLLAWFAILISIQSTYLFLPPYNFSASSVGLMNLAPFIGTVLAFFFGGYLNDKCIMWLSRRNGGIYEPEMRLWLALPMAVVTPAGILMLGVGMANVSFERITHTRQKLIFIVSRDCLGLFWRSALACLALDWSLLVMWHWHTQWTAITM